MRFSIRQSFSLLHINRHRTTRSEDFSTTTFTPGIPTASALTRSVSLEAVDEYPIVNESATLPKFDANPILHRVQTPVKSQYASATQTPENLGEEASPITVLRTANARLRDANATLAMEARILSEDLAKFSSDYYTEKNAVVALRREKKSAEEQAEKLESKLAEFSKFLDRLADLGLQEPVLARACDSLLAGEDADEALIGSIKEAATKEGTPWARIMPAIQGQVNGTSDEYLSAVNMILKTRKQLKRSEKVAKFWKQAAQGQGGADMADVTPSPSPSDISQLVNGCGIDHDIDATEVEPEGVSTCQERGSALEDLIAILHRGDAPVRRRPPTPSQSDRCRSPGLVPATMIPVLPSSNINHASTVTALSTSSKARPAIKPKRSFKHKSSIPRNTSMSPTPAQALAPLASKIFKEDLNATHLPLTYQFKFPKSSPARPVLADIGSISINNTNKPVSIDIPTSTPSSPSTTPFKPNFLFSAKALGKRRAVHIVDSQNTSLDAIAASFNATTPPPRISTLTSSIYPSPFTLSTRDPMSNQSFDEEVSFACDTIAEHTEDSRYTLEKSFDSLSNPKPSISASQVFMSLERICAGFSSGSLGSLGSTRDIFEQISPSPVAAIIPGPLSIPSPVTSDCSTLLADNSQGSDFSFVAESILDSASEVSCSGSDSLTGPKLSPSSQLKNSRLPTYKNPRLVSKSHVNTSSSVLKPTFSSAMRTVASPVRSLLVMKTPSRTPNHKRSVTAPLTIKKKTPATVNKPHHSSPASKDGTPTRRVTPTRKRTAGSSIRTIL